MGSFDATARCLIAKPRVAEMQARGWTVVGPGEEGTLLMEGPEFDGGFQPLARFAAPTVEAAWERAMERLNRRLARAA